MSTPNSQQVARSLRIQTVVALLLAGGLLLVGPVASYSSIFGSLAAYIPSLLFAMLVVPKFGANSAAFFRAAAIAEVVKLALTAVICMAVFVWVKPLAAGWFFAGMVAVIFSGRLGFLTKT